MSETFDIILTGRRWTFSRAQFLAKFPGSMVAHALEDTEAKEVKLENPVITPEVLDYLHFITKYRYTPPHPNWKMGDAGAYLGIPVMMLAGRPCWQRFTDIDLTDGKVMGRPENYFQLVQAAAQEEDLAVLRYLFEKVPVNEFTIDSDQKVMIEAIIN